MIVHRAAVSFRVVCYGSFDEGEPVARVLKGAGVGQVLTLCGGHILLICDSCLTEGIRVIDGRRERVAYRWIGQTSMAM